MPPELKDSLKKWTLLLCVCAGLGVLFSPLRSFFKDAGEGESTRQIISNTAGQGVLFGILGGYRSLIADFVWIKSYLYWEQRRLSECLAAMDLAVAIDPKMVSFWKLGSDIIGYDTPVWIMEDMRKKGAQVSPELEASVRRRQAKRAVAFLDEGLKRLPGNETLTLAKAQIYVNRLDDWASALEEYKKIMDTQEDPPVFVRRYYAECLVKTGRLAPAVKVLEALLKILERDEPLYPIVEARIAELKVRISAMGG